MEIWLVSTGEYSDYTVNGVFDEKHKPEAEEFADLIGGRVEEEAMELNPTHQEPPSGQTFYTLHIERNGSTKYVMDYKSLDSSGNLYTPRHRVHKAGEWFMFVGTYARDKKHAIKIANEIRIQVLAGTKPTDSEANADSKTP